MFRRFLIALFLIPSCNPPTSSLVNMKIEYDTLSMIPPAIGQTVQPGLAGALTGSCGSYLVVAGGSNFADNLPWRGGIKLYHDDIYILKTDSDGKLTWIQPTQKLSEPVAYSANVQTKDGFIVIGGENLKGMMTSVSKISVVDDSLQIKALPSLPVGLSNAGATLLDSQLIVCGGLDSKGASNKCFGLNLTNLSSGWKDLPDLPEALSHGVVAAQSDGNENCIFVVGGRAKTGVTSTFFSTIWKYSPSKMNWSEVGSLKLDDKKLGLSAGTGVAYGNRWIILIGGDQGNLYSRTELFNDSIARSPEGPDRNRVIQEKDEFLTTHPGFSRDVLAFNTRSAVLKKLGVLPVASQVTTTAFWWNDRIIIPGGEVRPGVRTALISSLKITKEKD